MAEVHVRGLAELQKFLDQLPAKMEANVMRSALRAGANVVREEAMRNVPVKSGLLKAGLKVSTRSRRGVVTANVRATGKHAYIAPWIEYGTSAYEIKPKKSKSLFFAGLFSKLIQHPGIKAKPFLRPALDHKAHAALVAIREQIKKRLTKQGLNVSEVEIEA